MRGIYQCHFPSLVEVDEGGVLKETLRYSRIKRPEFKLELSDYDNIDILEKFYKKDTYVPDYKQGVVFTTPVLIPNPKLLLL